MTASFKGRVPAPSTVPGWPVNPDTAVNYTFDELSDEYTKQVEGLTTYGFLELLSVAGTTDAITASTVFATNDPPGLAALARGNRFRLVPVLANTGPATLAIDGAAAATLKANNGDDLAAGHLQPGRSYDFVYNGTNLIDCDVGSTFLAGNRAPDDIFECRRSAGTSDGNSTTATADDRLINTSIKNTSATLNTSNGQITIPPGKWRLRATVPFWGSGLGRAQVYSVTDTALLTDQNGNTVYGSVEDSGTAVTVKSIVDTILNLASTKTVKIQTIVTTGVTNGLGKAANLASGQEVYTRVEITKIDETSEDFEGEPGGALTETFEFDDDTTGAAPVNGQLAFDNASFASATTMVISKTSAAGRAIASMLASLGAGTSTKKADLELFLESDRTQFVRFSVTSLTDLTSHYSAAVSKIDGSVDELDAGDALVATFTRVGDAGTSGTLTTIVTPGAFSADQNDLDVGSIGRQLIKVSTDGTNRSITGLLKKATGEIVDIENTDASKTITLEDSHSGSSAANRFNFGRDVLLKPKYRVTIVYDEDTDNWKLRAINYPTSEFDAAEVTVASAATADIGGAASVRVAISGTTAITSFGTVADKIRFVRFTGSSLTLTYNGTSLITLTGKDRIVAAGDTAVWMSDSSGNWRELSFTQAAILPGKNYVDNPSFNNWQRGTSFALAAATRTAVADRWKAYRTPTGCTISRQTGFAVTGSSSSPKYCLRWARDSGNTSAATLRLWHQPHEFIARGLAGQRVVVSFDVRCGANYSGTAIGVRIHTGTGGSEAVDLSLSTAAAFATGGAVTTVSDTVTPTTTAQRLVCTPLLLASNIADLAIQITWTPSGTAGAADYIEITNVKLEVGAVATQFVPPDEAADLTACQYTYRYLSGGQMGYAASATTLNVRYPLLPPMRATPTLTLLSTTPGIFGTGVTQTGSGATISSSAFTTAWFLGITLTGFSGMTTNAVGIFGALDWISLDAELLS